MGKTAQRFDERMMPHLKSLAATFLNDGAYGYLKVVAEIMEGLGSGGWASLPDEDKEYFLERMREDFHPKGMGDSRYGDDEDYLAITALLDSEHRTVVSRLR